MYSLDAEKRAKKQAWFNTLVTHGFTCNRQINQPSHYQNITCIYAFHYTGIPNGLTASIEGQDYKRKIEVRSLRVLPRVLYWKYEVFLLMYWLNQSSTLQVPPPSDSPLKRGNLKRSKYSPTLASMVQRSPVATKDTLGGTLCLLFKSPRL